MLAGPKKKVFHVSRLNMMLLPVCFQDALFQIRMSPHIPIPILIFREFLSHVDVGS